MKYTYKTKGTCSTLIELELEGNVVHNYIAIKNKKTY